MPNSNQFVVFMLLLISLNVSCQKKSDQQIVEVKEVKVTDMGTEIKVPVEIWHLLQSKKDDKDKPKESKEVASLTIGSVDFLPIKVRLREKTQGVLVAPEIAIDFPRGGGEVDFAKYVTDKNGTFYVNFDFDPDSDKEKFDIYYISRARKRKIDDEVWGVGCKKFINLKSFYYSKIKQGEFSLNTTRARYLTVMGGHFVFASKSERQTYLAQVTFSDSRHPVLMCSSEENK